MEIAKTIEVDIGTTIATELQQLERAQQITILYACESGSRA
ncbi:DNA polymerase beta superfamily protein [Chamaesiphon sp. VAR_69_metabat_338]|nr:nucleotidyltransferase domain-containing protein [Chamaesiphon sp. VAR_69_metabat_338]